MPFKPTRVLICLLIFLFCGISSTSAESQISKKKNAQPMTAVDSANTLFDEIMDKYADDTSQDGQSECAKLYLKLCDIYYHNGYYTNAFSAAANALKIAEANGLENLLAPAYNNIGKIYCSWDDTMLGIEYFKKGLAHCSPETDKDLYRSLIINIQGAYINGHKPSLAKPYYLNMKRVLKHDSIVDYFLIFNKGLFLLEEGKDRDAINLFRKAEELAERYKLGTSMQLSPIDLIGDALVENDTDSAVFYWNKAISNHEVPAYMRLKTLKKLWNVSKARKDKQKAFDYGSRYMDLADSLFEITSINKIKDMQLAYENEKKNKRISVLDAEKNTQEVKLALQQRFLLLSTCAVFIFIVISVVVIIQKHRLQQAYKDLFSHNREVMEIQEISQSKEEMLCSRINELEQRLEKTCGTDNESECECPDGNDIQATGKTQSVDRLSDTKRNEILSAIEKVMKNEDIILK